MIKKWMLWAKKSTADLMNFWISNDKRDKHFFVALRNEPIICLGNVKVVSQMFVSYEVTALRSGLWLFVTSHFRNKTEFWYLWKEHQLIYQESVSFQLLPWRQMPTGHQQKRYWLFLFMWGPVNDHLPLF